MPTLYFGEAEASLLREWVDGESARVSPDREESEDLAYEQCWLEILRDQRRARQRSAQYRATAEERPI